MRYAKIMDLPRQRVAFVLRFLENYHKHCSNWFGIDVICHNLIFAVITQPSAFFATGNLLFGFCYDFAPVFIVGTSHLRRLRRRTSKKRRNRFKSYVKLVINLVGI